MSEIYVHSRHFEAHQYLLHQLDLSVKVAMNNNTENNKPKITVNVGFPQILLSLSLKQIRTALKVVAYMNLSTLYQRGIAREYYNKELTEHEKMQYMELYLDYFNKKYILQQNFEFPSSLVALEDHLEQDKISELRSKAILKLHYINVFALFRYICFKYVICIFRIHATTKGRTKNNI